MNRSGIEWIRLPDGTYGLTCNPVIGCERTSPGCGGGYIVGPDGERGGCWAEDLVSTRMSKNPRLPMYADLARPSGGWSGVVKLVPERIKEIVALGRKGIPERVFLCDLSDLFHDDVPFEYIAAVFGAVASAPESLFYVLTKRPERALKFAAWLDEIMKSHVEYDHVSQFLAMQLFRYANIGDTSAQQDWTVPGSVVPDQTVRPWPLPNLAFGVTVEDTRFGVPRLALGRRFPAKYHFASVEPLLADIGSDVDFSGYDLVIEGGEAGPGARPHDLAWARNVRDAARRVGARFFMKQAGDYVIDGASEDVINIFDVRRKVIRTVDKSFANITEAQNLEGHRARPHRLHLGKKGNDFAKLPEDLQIRENLPMPGKP